MISVVTGGHSRIQYGIGHFTELATVTYSSFDAVTSYKRYSSITSAGFVNYHGASGSILGTEESKQRENTQCR
jgi:UDP-N-acetylglucosamine transferase subunit ALG13